MCNSFNVSSENFTQFITRDISLVIPRYQRNYSWDILNVVEFINDVYNHEKKYYVGNIIISISNKYYEVIDGQQRLITIFLIIIALINEYQINLRYVITCNNLVRLSIANRIDANGSNLLDSILNKDALTPKQEKYNEYKIYKAIKSILDEKSRNDSKYIMEFSDKLLNLVFVITSFSNETKPHEMFITINTKGKILSNADIIKSLIFQYLLSGSNNDVYKEYWHEMTHDIGEINLDNYLLTVMNLLERDIIREKNVIDKYKERISNVPSAKVIFNYLTKGNKLNKISMLNVYQAIYNYDIDSLNKYYDEEIGYLLDSLNNLWRHFGDLKFRQFNILVMAILYYDDDVRRKDRIVKNHLQILRFVKLMIMHMLYLSAGNTSPSTYADTFKKNAFMIMQNPNDSTLVECIRDCKQQLKIRKLESDEVFKVFNGLICSGGRNGDHKKAKLIVQIVDDNLSGKMIAEHILCKDKYDKSFTYSFGNILPVTQDIYKDFDITQKNIEYEKVKAINSSVAKYLNNKFTELTYENDLKARCKTIVDSFTLIYNSLIDYI